MATIGDGNSRRDQRLKSWKQIAAFFGADERTVRRWEKRGLPVRRLPGRSGATVYADVAELETWLKGEQGRPEEPVASRRRYGTAIAAAALLAMPLAGAAILSIRKGPAPAALEVSRHRPPQRAIDLYLAGTYNWERRTPESLRRAIALFGQAIAEDPAYAEAHAGLAHAYIVLRKYSAVSEQVAYPRARAAAERALELDPNLAQAHVAMAFINFYWDWNFEAAFAHYRRAVALDPRAALTHHSYAGALLHAGRPQDALAEIEAAQRLDPRSRVILADKGLMLFAAGRRAEAGALLFELAADEPDFASPQYYLWWFALVQGDYRAAVDRLATVGRLRQDGDTIALAERMRRALGEGGGRAMLRTLLAGEERLHAQHRESAYALAETCALLGDKAAALRYLRQSVDERDPLALQLRFDPLLANLRDEPEFRRLSERVGRAS